MMKLIPSVESLTYPNPAAGEIAKSMQTGAAKTDSNGTSVQTTNGAKRSNSTDEKKRVRFDDGI